jgi:tetratricopeptide (TPR) repeat protein
LEGNARVDCWNALSLAYTYLNLDTATLYQQNAYDAAVASQYARGIGMSLNNKARIAGIGFHNYPAAEQISLQTLQKYKSSADEKVLAETYMNLSLALFCQGFFDRSAGACDSLIRLAEKAADKIRLGEAEAVLGSIYFETGKYDKSFDYFNRSLALFESIDDSYNIAILLAKIGDLYCLAGDDKKGLDFYFQSLQYPLGPTIIWHPLVDLGDTYYSLKQYDAGETEHEKYVQTIKSMTVRSNYMAYPRVRKAETLIGSKAYGQALELLNGDLQRSKQGNDRNQVMRLLFDMVKGYEGLGDYRQAFKYTNELLQIAGSYNARQYILSGYKLKYDLFDHLNQPDSSYAYFRRYTSMKDSIALGEFGKKMDLYAAEKENEKQQGQIELLNKEKQISKQQLELGSQRLRNESFQKNILIIGSLVLILLGFIFVRYLNLKRKNEAIRYQKQSLDLEMQALRAQMNPHFIFNCLNSINRFTINHEAAKAADYLTKFAKLIRIVLQQSGMSFIPLEDELNSLQLYMELEAIRFEHPFRYQICSDAVKAGEIKVPPLLLQPFVENAIWHGLHPKQNGQGEIRIDCKLSGDILDCRISDNGVGRQMANGRIPGDSGKKTSLGIKLTQHRLELFETSLKERKAVITIHDLTDDEGASAGTSVLIRIPIKSD